MNTRRNLIAFFTLAFIFVEILSSYKVKSNLVQPPAGYVGNPPVHQACTYCHGGSATISDSVNFSLLIGPDTSHLSVLTSNVTTYVPNQTYFLRIQAHNVHPRYGFELSADDASGNGADVGSFTVLDATNTSLVTGGPGGGNYIGHYNASTNNQWTFQWTAPATNIGAITFYWAGNDANGDDQQTGDTIYAAKKTINATTTGINNIASELADVNVFPTVTSGSFQLQFNMVNNQNIKAEIMDMNGQTLQSVLNEALPQGNYERSVDVSKLASGIYLLKMQVGNDYLVKKIIKQ